MSNIDSALVASHKNLNPKIWSEDNNLKPEVQVALLRIAKEFYEFLDFDAPLADIQVTGSQANFNYTILSDLDLHLIVPFESVTCDQPVESMFDAKRKLWKERHDITIHGIPVEVYVEDTARPVNGSTFSVLKNKWLSKPVYREADWDQEEILREVKIWLERMVTVVSSRDLEKIQDFREQLSDYRQSGLDANGEFGTENLTFKALRNLGAISQLMQILASLEDQNLSI